MPKIKKVKMKKSEIKRDKFAEGTMQLFKDITDNWKKYLIIFSILLFVILGIQYFVNNMNKKNMNASKEIYNAVETYLSGNYEGAIPMFETIKSKYYGTQTSKKCNYYIASANMYLGNFDEAIKFYNNFLKSHSNNNMLKGNTYIAIGHCYESKGELDSALIYYDKLVNEMSESYLLPSAYLAKGRVFEMKMMVEDAISQYNAVIYGYPNTGFAHTAVLYRNMLEGAIDVLKQMQVNKAVKKLNQEKK